MTGMPSRFEFLPGIFKFRQYCEQVATEYQEHERRVREAAKPRLPAPRQQPDESDLYTGPIEDIRPGDKLNHKRIPEYEAFIRSKGIVPKVWGFFETWKDTGQRPFQPLSAKPEAKSDPDNNSNPFDP